MSDELQEIRELEYMSQRLHQLKLIGHPWRLKEARQALDRLIVDAKRTRGFMLVEQELSK